MVNSQTQNTVSRKKVSVSLIGFILAVMILFTCGLTAIPSLILCIVGIIRKDRLVLALIGLVIALFCFLFLLPYCFITFTPPGSMPYPLNNYKFRRACNCDFWIDYDPSNMVEVQSQNTIILKKFGSVRFQAEPGRYKIEDIIDFAQKNGWIFHLEIQLTKEDFDRFKQETKDTGEDRFYLADTVIWWLHAQHPLWIQDDCFVLAFETENVHGIASFVIIKKDGSEIVIQYNSPRVPDPASTFWLPPEFERLNKLQSQVIKNHPL